ncbi:hypothetical protein TIFTF001_013343 [Ficus carica]|uniref:Protein FAR1-RELATED SEQUENCE n=1 Tax=Ficus carica TaxID=3494 RepID=A0AA88AE51_FICCA|nr:hypothetical protein TIFTF001_013343 [Ficus carica]
MFTDRVKRSKPIASSIGSLVHGRYTLDLNIPTRMMDSNVVVGHPVVEPHDGMEFESHEAAYSFYKEYAKSVGFGTAKLSSRRSRASKEFIDAKFSCIRYGNKQQSDDAINPRPSPKIGCKASMHVKRRQSGKWYVYCFVKEHNHELLPAQAHFFRSHRNADPLKNDVRIRRRKNLAAVSKLFTAFNLRQVEWIQSLYEDRLHWVPTFMKDISFAALSRNSRSESLNSFFDKYVQGETSLRDFMERHAIIVLQMTGVFSIPPKYVLQRWTNSAVSRHSISEKMDDVQRKVRRYNDLCRRAIILGEEGSLSQESYNVALSAIKEALKQCASLNNSAENNARPNALAVGGVCAIEEGNQYGDASNYEVSGPKATTTKRAPRRVGAGKEVAASNEKSATKKGKVHPPEVVTSVGTQGGFGQLELSDQSFSPLENVVPAQLHNMVPAMFQNVASAQFHNVASTHAHENHLPR